VLEQLGNKYIDKAINTCFKFDLWSSFKYLWQIWI